MIMPTSFNFRTKTISEAMCKGVKAMFMVVCLKRHTHSQGRNSKIILDQGLGILSFQGSGL
jgi:hypothetical protein